MFSEVFQPLNLNGKQLMRNKNQKLLRWQKWVRDPWDVLGSLATDAELFADGLANKPALMDFLNENYV